MSIDPKPDTLLLPCPFCGSNDLSLDDARDFISCRSCWTEGPVDLAMGMEHNIKAWNARPVANAAIAQARRDALEEAARVCEAESWRLKDVAIRTQSAATNTAAIQASKCADAVRALADKPEGV